MNAISDNQRPVQEVGLLVNSDDEIEPGKIRVSFAGDAIRLTISPKFQFSAIRTLGAPSRPAISARADQLRLQARPAGRLIPPLSSGLLACGGVSQLIGLGVVLTTDMGYGEGKRPCQLLAGPIKGIETRAAAGVCARHLSDHDLGIRVDMKDRGVERQSALEGLQQRHVFRYIVVLMTNPSSNSNRAAVRTVDHHADSGRPRVAQRTAVNIGYKR